MKLAVILARTSAGLELVKVGEDIAEIKAAFKTAKVADALQVNGHDASQVIYLDSAGNVKRKSLSGGDGAAAARKIVEAEAAAKQKQADEEAAAKAKAVAEKAVNVIIDSIKEGVPAKPEETPKESQEDEESEDPANRFAPPKGGGKRNHK